MSPGARPIRAVVFDLFDTLVDLELERLPRVEHQGQPVSGSAVDLHAAVCKRASIEFEDFLRTLADVDAEFRESRYARHRELPTLERFTTLAARLGVDDPELPEELTRVHMGVLRGHVITPHHHADVLSRLASSHRLAVCSNFSHSQTALAVLDEARIRERFDAIVVSDMVGWRKPRPEIFRATLAALDVAPEETLHVGDNLRADVAGAAAVGMQTAWVTRRVSDTSARLRTHDGPRPDHQVADLAELVDLVGGGARPSP
ncbi:MAG: HAD family hydrolase [Proteobacteria bacterium]|nr:HAD family hydrolase [Pseudomonadota bacterium]